MLYTILTIIIAIICALLIIVVLLQNGSGQGLSGIGATSMGGSAGLGARRTADLLSKSTSYLGGAFLLLCVLANFVIDRPTNTESILQSGAPLESVGVPATPPARESVPLMNDMGTATEEAGGSNETSEN
jgi:preprotein translocase subunit SecG